MINSRMRAAGRRSAAVKAARTRATNRAARLAATRAVAAARTLKMQEAGRKSWVTRRQNIALDAAAHAQAAIYPPGVDPRRLTSTQRAGYKAAATRRARAL